MATLRFLPDADAELRRLLDSPELQTLYERLNDLLDILEDDPGDHRVRRRRYDTIDSWGFDVHGSGEDLLVIWTRPDEPPEVILVKYIGPKLDAHVWKIWPVDDD